LRSPDHTAARAASRSGSEFAVRDFPQQIDHVEAPLGAGPRGADRLSATITFTGLY